MRSLSPLHISTPREPTCMCERTRLSLALSRFVLHSIVSPCREHSRGCMCVESAVRNARLPLNDDFCVSSCIQYLCVYTHRKIAIPQLTWTANRTCQCVLCVCMCSRAFGCVYIQSKDTYLYVCVCILSLQNRFSNSQLSPTE